MAWIPRIRGLFQREKLAKELEEELEFHLLMREQWNVDQGIPPGQARREARRHFGNPTLWREQMSEIDLMVLPETIMQDLRYGARMLWHNPVFTGVAVLALALGIGINTTFFTAHKAIIARSLDARDPGTMVNLALVRHSEDADPRFSYPDYEAYRDHLRSFSGLIAEDVQPLTLSGVAGGTGQRGSAAASLVGRLGLLPSGTAASPAEFANTAIVSENYFSVLGIAILRGRTFESQDVRQLSASPAVLISENYWQRRFAGDPSILGKSIRLDGAAFTIIGITPHDFVGTSVTAPDFWLPLGLEPLVHADDNWLHDRENQCCRLFGRLAPGVTIGQAQAEMTLLADHLRTLHDAHSELRKPATGEIWPGSPYPYKLDSGLKFAILLIMVAVGMVLVIACANVSSLQLARAASRQNELCMRLSLGASRPRLIRQLLTESALLALLAGGVALLFSWALLKVLVVMAAEAIPPEYGSLVLHVTPDVGIFAYVFAISLLAGVLFGLAPALESTRSALFSALNNTGGASLRSRRLRDALMTIQVAITLMLMIAGSMLIRSSIHALKMETGYDGKQVVDIEVQFPKSVKYTPDRQLAIVRELRAHLAALPGVAAITTGRPPDGPGERTAAVSLNGDKPSVNNTQAFLSYTYVQPNYFQTLGIPLLSGRSFQAQRGQPEHSVILSESAAKALWPAQNPIGRSLRLGTDGQFHNKNEVLPDGPAYQVIGVARDTRGVALDGSDSQQVYVPLPEDRLQDHPILIRTYADPMLLTSAIRPVISSIDPNLVATSYTLEEILRQTPAFMIPSLAATIASIVGLFGLLLASMGIYGTVSYIVALRTREVGIRIALGAQKREILGLILRTSTRPVLAGLLVGVCLAVGASYLLRGVLYGLNPVDGIYFVGVFLLLLGIALFAAYLPSRRAMRVDPMVVLRYE
jgi:predicted permease